VVLSHHLTAAEQRRQLSGSFYQDPVIIKYTHHSRMILWTQTAKSWVQIGYNSTGPDTLKTLEYLHWTPRGRGALNSDMNKNEFFFVLSWRKATYLLCVCGWLGHCSPESVANMTDSTWHQIPPITHQLYMIHSYLRKRLSLIDTCMSTKQDNLHGSNDSTVSSSWCGFGNNGSVHCIVSQRDTPSSSESDCQRLHISLAIDGP